MNDATILLRDIAGDAATKAAGKVNPSDDQLAQIDAPAEDNTWHDKPDYGAIKSNIQNKMPMKKQDAKDAASDAADQAKSAADGQAQATDASKEGAKQGAGQLKSNLSNRFDDEQKEKLRQYRERSNNYFKGKMPKERRDQTIYRLKKMIVEIQTHQDCRCCQCRRMSMRQLTLCRQTRDRYPPPPGRRIRRPRQDPRQRQPGNRERCNRTR